MFLIYFSHQVVKILNATDEHVMALGANFSLQADSHLVCIQSEQGYKTQAINIQNQARKGMSANLEYNSQFPLQRSNAKSTSHPVIFWAWKFELIQMFTSVKFVCPISPDKPNFAPRKLVDDSYFIFERTLNAQRLSPQKRPCVLRLQWNSRHLSIFLCKIMAGLIAVNQSPVESAKQS